jgi:DNA mismatch endonuclease (patch repair protein)
VFPARHKVIFVHGCFWHFHNCKPGLIPSSNQDFWLPKLRQNSVRDTKNLEALAEQGWKALVIWQCEMRDSRSLRLKIVRFLGRPGSPKRKGS